jgi:hypothetical protein
MAVVGNELVTSVGNTLCAWDLRQLSAGAFLFLPASEKAIRIVARVVEMIRHMLHLTLTC